MADPAWGNVLLQLSLNGTDGATGSGSFPDASSFARTATVNNSLPLSTTRSKYGSASAYVDNLRYLSYSSLGGQSTWTIEFYFNLNVKNTAINLCTWTGVGSVALGYVTATDTIDLNGSASGALGLALDTWYHVAIVATGTTKKVYIDGTLVLTQTISNANLSSLFLGMSASHGGTQGTFYFDEVRVSAEEVYTGNFTPPSAPFPITSTAVGAASGAGTTSAAGESTAKSPGAASGAGTAAGAGKASVASTGAASGAGTAAAIATGIVTAVGTASGAGSAAANANGPTTGSASGAGTAAAVGASTASSIGQAFGAATVTASGSLAACYPVSMAPVLMGKPTGPSSSFKPRKARGLSPVEFGYPIAFHNA